jgi:hypothetical protein
MGLWLHALACVVLSTQAPTASVSGTVRDAESGAPVAGVVVSLPSLGRIALSDSLGHYLLDRIPAGTQELTARRMGYAPWTVQLLVPEEGMLEVAFALRPEPVPVAEIEVRAAPPEAPWRSPRSEGENPPSVALDRGLSAVELRNNPLVAEPDYFAAVTGGEVFVAPESPEGIHLQGGATDQVAFVLDGIPVFSPYHAGGTFSAWNPDALAHAGLTTANVAGGAPEVLGATMVGRTEIPGAAVETRGAVTATHTGIRLSAPIGHQGGGALFGLRTGFAGLLGHQSDATYLGGENRDWLAKLEFPLLGGRLFVLGYGSDDVLGAAASALVAAGPMIPAHHHFDWGSGSYGAGWSGPFHGHLLEIRAWAAGTDAEARWIGAAAPVHLASSRQDVGLSTSIRGVGQHSSTAVGLRVVASRTDYRTLPPAGTEEALRLGGDQLLATASVEHHRRLTGRSGLDLSLTGTWTAGDATLGPAADLWWRPVRRLTLSASYTRRHQFSQSLRNPESVVGAVFPADLTVGSGSGSIPVAQSDLGTFAVDYRPADGIRIGVRAYAGAARGLVLVAVRETGPFASGPAAIGSSSTHGAVFEFAARRSGIQLLATYGYQRTWFEADGVRYRPFAAVPHAIDAGITLLPSAGWSVRVGVSGLYARRATEVRGPFEWESCNLRDRGCEFAGSPELAGPLGGVALPGYLRVDLGLRHEWRVSLFGRAGTLAASGTVTNLLNRRNLLTTTVNPATGTHGPVEMRPRAPLTVGLDWRF